MGRFYEGQDVPLNSVAYGGVKLQLRSFLTSSLDGGECLASRPNRFTPVERALGTNCTEVWVGTTADL
jgi:hypothetical protein